jgi:hypothetical protein
MNIRPTFFQEIGFVISWKNRHYSFFIRRVVRREKQ